MSARWIFLVLSIWSMPDRSRFAPLKRQRLLGPKRPGSAEAIDDKMKSENWVLAIPKYTTISRFAGALPCVEEQFVYKRLWYRVGKKVFACYLPQSKRWVLKLPADQQMMLFDTRPMIFTPMRSGRMTWSYVKVEKLSTAELRDLVTAAWRVVAPKRIQNTLSN